MALVFTNRVPQKLVHEKHNGMSFGVFYTHAYKGTSRKSGVTDDANNDRLPAN